MPRYAEQAVVLWLAGMLLATWAAYWQYRHNLNGQSTRFAALSEQVAEDVRHRMQLYEYGLRGARGAVLGAGGDSISRQRFVEYSRSRDLQREFPGARGFGFIRRVAADRIEAFERAARSEGPAHFSVHHLAPHQGEVFVIQYIEPVGPNAPAVGLNVASEPRRREAALRSMALGEPVMTAPITLVQSSGLRLQSVLVLLPVYRAGAPLETARQRDAATLGWTYTPLELSQVLLGMETADGPFAMTLLDTAAEGGPVPLYTSRWSVDASAPVLQQEMALSVFNRPWRLVVQARPAFVTGLNQRNPLALWAGLAAGWSALTLVWALVRTSSRHRQDLGTQQARLAAIVDSSNDAVVAKTLDGVITDWNAAAERIFGHTAAEAIGQSVASLLVPSDRQAEELDILRRVGQGETLANFDTVRRHKNGRLIDVSVSVSPIRDNRGRIIGAAKVARDISDRKATEARILELNAALAQQVSEGRLREQVLLDQALSSIIVTDAQGRITLFNPAAEKLLGYRADEVIGKAVMGLFHDDTEVRNRVHLASALLGRSLEPGEVFLPHIRTAMGDNNEWLYVHRDGTRIPVLLTVGTLQDERGQLVGFIGIAADLRERKKLETELLRAESASEAKDLFLANMSHEIRTPLNAIIGLTFLLEQSPLTPDQRDLLHKTHLASKNLLSVINDVLDLSKIEAGEMLLNPQPFLLRGLLDDALALAEAAAHGKGLALVLDAPEDLPRQLQGDAVRLQQVLTNLLTNAVKFTERGQITLQVRVLHHQGQRLRLRMAVRDTGIGIPPQVQARLFMPFTQADASITRRFGGTGLGLSIVRNLVDLMGGELGLTSAEGQGSEFWFSLCLPVVDASPASGGPATGVLQAGAAHTQRLAGVRVLLVDDSSINREVGQRVLAREGADVTLAEDGEQALARLRRSPTGFNVVLMDLQMPVLDGHSAARHIRQDLGLGTLPIVALTAGALHSERERALAAGMNDFIVKPFDPEDMVQRVHRHARGSDLFPHTPTPAPQESTRADADFAARLMAQFARDSQALLHPPPDLEPEASRQQWRRHMHRLRGTAGVLGLHELHQAATRAEQVLHQDAGPADAQALAEVVRWLGPALAGAPEDVPPPGIEPGPSPQPAELQHLAALLLQHNLEALAVFQRLRPGLAGVLPPVALLQMDDALRGLRFPAALAVLEHHGLPPHPEDPPA